MLNKALAEDVKKYSFVDDVKIVGGNFVIYYRNKDKEKFIKLPIRVSLSRLQKELSKIYKELGLSKYGKGKNQDIYIA